MSNEDRQAILPFDKHIYVQKWLQNIDSPNTNLNKNKEQKSAEKTEKIKIISNVIINQDNEIYDFHDEFVKEEYHPIRKRQIHSEVSIPFEFKFLYF